MARAIQHTAQLYGSIQDIAGSAALPEIKTLALGDAKLPTEATSNQKTS
jgi:hypothetical protein